MRGRQEVRPRVRLTKSGGHGTGADIEPRQQPCGWNRYVTLGVVSSICDPHATVGARLAAPPPGVDVRAPPKPRFAARCDQQIAALQEDAIERVQDRPTYRIRVLSA